MATDFIFTGRTITVGKGKPAAEFKRTIIKKNQKPRVMFLTVGAIRNAYDGIIGWTSTVRVGASHPKVLRLEELDKANKQLSGPDLIGRPMRPDEHAPPPPRRRYYL